MKYLLVYLYLLGCESKNSHMGKAGRDMDNIDNLYSVLSFIQCLLQKYITNNYDVAIWPLNPAFPIPLSVANTLLVVSTRNNC